MTPPEISPSSAPASDLPLTSPGSRRARFGFSRGDSSPLPPETARLDYIDALRGFAALWVAAFHTVHNYSPQTVSPNRVTALLVRVFEFGHVGVNLFLVISGFCLFYPIAKKASARNMPPLSFGGFMAKRARRILPPYYALLALLALGYLIAARLRLALPGFPEPASFVDAWDLPAHVLLIHNLFPSYLISVTTPLWSIALEWQLYLLFPALVWITQRRGIWQTAAAALALSGVFQLLLWRFLPQPADPDVRWHITAAAYWSLPSRLFEFVLGMATAYCVARSPRKYHAAAIFLFLAAALAGVYVCDRFGMFAPLVSCLWGVAAAALILFLNALSAFWPEWQRYLRPLTVVGTFSYSVYLVHMAFVSGAAPFVRSFHLSLTASSLVFFGLVLPIVLAYAYLFHCLFERPFMRARRSRV